MPAPHEESQSRKAFVPCVGHLVARRLSEQESCRGAAQATGVVVS